MPTTAPGAGLTFPNPCRERRSYPGLLSVVDLGICTNSGVQARYVANTRIFELLKRSDKVEVCVRKIGKERSCGFFYFDDMLVFRLACIKIMFANATYLAFMPSFFHTTIA